MAKPYITIYSDGGAKPSPNGPGGWASVLILDDEIAELSGQESSTTNSRMKLMAVFMALESLEDSSKIELYIDSKYVKSGVTQWMAKWALNGWRMSNHQPVENKDLWEGLHEMTETHEIHWHWSKNNIPFLYEARVVELVTAARELYTAPPMVALMPDGMPKVDTTIYVASSYISGSWAAVLVTKTDEKEIEDRELNTTFNQTILLACAKLLESLTTPQTVAIYSINEYLVNGMTKWLRNWVKNDWHTASGEAVKNQEQWQRLLAAEQPHTITWILCNDFQNVHMIRANNLVID
ncbi:MAG: hypothetical protein H0X30_28705 [Anaerolineae bacterium]|nr:hypothetical protein [Anaerolineae bacterium]